RDAADAMEESEQMWQSTCRIGKPVIFTGAQFTADHPDADGPEHIATAIRLASDPANAAKGVQTAFGGRIIPAWGAYKFSSDNGDAFRSARPLIVQSPVFPAPVGDRRVDMIAIYPGCDALHIEASIAAGASGIV